MKESTGRVIRIDCQAVTSYVSGSQGTRWDMGVHRLVEEGHKQPILHPHVANDELQKVAMETDCPELLDGDLCR
jgi:hypothetical protein